MHPMLIINAMIDALCSLFCLFSWILLPLLLPCSYWMNHQPYVSIMDSCIYWCVSDAWTLDALIVIIDRWLRCLLIEVLPVGLLLQIFNSILDCLISWGTFVHLVMSDNPRIKYCLVGLFHYVQPKCCWKHSALATKIVASWFENLVMFLTMSLCCMLYLVGSICWDIIYISENNFYFILLSHLLHCGLDYNFKCIHDLSCFIYKQSLKLFNHAIRLCIGETI